MRSRKLAKRRDHGKLIAVGPELRQRRAGTGVCPLRPSENRHLGRQWLIRRQALAISLELGPVHRSTAQGVQLCVPLPRRPQRPEELRPIARPSHAGAGRPQSCHTGRTLGLVSPRCRSRGGVVFHQLGQRPSRPCCPRNDAVRRPWAGLSWPGFRFSRPASRESACRARARHGRRIAIPGEGLGARLSGPSALDTARVTQPVARCPFRPGPG
jgi:hypothetical protein